MEAFSNACGDFDRISPLDPWKTDMLTKVKVIIEATTSGEADVC